MISLKRISRGVQIFEQIMGLYCFVRVAAVCTCCLRLLLCDVRTIEILGVAFLDMGQVSFREPRLG